MAVVLTEAADRRRLENVAAPVDGHGVSESKRLSLTARKLAEWLAWHRAIFAAGVK